MKSNIGRTAKSAAQGFARGLVRAAAAGSMFVTFGAIGSAGLGLPGLFGLAITIATPAQAGSPCPAGQVLDQRDGRCHREQNVRPSCPAGQVLDRAGFCSTAGCPAGQVLDRAGQCRSDVLPAAARPCPAGQVLDRAGRCRSDVLGPTPTSCPAGQVLDRAGFCSTAACPAWQVLGRDGRCRPRAG